MGNFFSLCNKSCSPNQFIALKSTEMQDLEDHDQWLKYFQSQSQSLQKKHIWAKKLPSKLRNFKCPLTRQHYALSVLSIYQTHQILNQSSLNQSQSVEFEENKQKAFMASYENNSFISTIPRKTEDGVGLYKLISSLIERHLKEIQNHHLGFLLSEFIGWFYDSYKKVLILENTRGLERKSLEKSHKTSIENLQQFIRVYAETLMLYYQINKISNNGKLQAFSKENFINFVTSLLFSYDKIYQIVFFMQKALDQTFEGKFQLILGLRDSFEIVDYLIPKKLCLLSEAKKPLRTKKYSNDMTFFSFSSDFETPNRTFCYQDNFKRPAEFESFHSFQQEDFYLERFNSFDDMNNPNIRGKPLILDNEIFNSGEGMGSSKIPIFHYKRKTPIQKTEETSYENKESLTKTNVAFITNIPKTKPYLEAIKLLEELSELRSPVHKMKRILMVISQIMSSITSFSEPIESDTLDQKYLFCILLYIVGQSHCVDLHSQLKIIEKFSTNNVLASVSGYYFTLLQLVVKFLEELDHGALLGGEKKDYLRDRIEEILRDLKRNILL